MSDVAIIEIKDTTRILLERLKNGKFWWYHFDGVVLIISPY